MWYDPFTTGLAPLFGVPALIGTGFFLFRLIASGAGMADGHGHDFDGHGDVGGHGDAGGGAVDAAEGAGDHGALSAKALAHTLGRHAKVTQGISLQGAFSFLMGFGWAGLIGYSVAGLGAAVSGVIGVGGGLGIAALARSLVRNLRRFERDGSIAIDRCLGLEAEVYLTVPARAGSGTIERFASAASPAGSGASGQVRVVVDGRARIYNAVSRDSTSIATGGRVLVVAANPDNSLTVQALP